MNLRNTGILLMLCAIGSAGHAGERKVRVETSDHFSVWASKVDGTDRRLIMTDPKRQITHTRISPDMEWMTFSTYNNFGKNGLAIEDNNYANSELCIMKLDGTEMRTIAGPVPGEINCNGSFSSDGKRIVFMSTRSGDGCLLYWYDMATGNITKVPTPSALHVLSDPHEVKDRIIFPSRPEKRGESQAVWMMHTDGTDARQISFPKKPENAPREALLIGDYDCRMSPDCTTVSIFRNVGGAFHIVLLTVATGEEIDMTEPFFTSRNKTAEGVVDWSSDGRLMIFRHIALDHDGMAGVGLYVMRQDGSGRKKITLAAGEFPHCQPGFFPEGSGPQARIIYQTQKNPNFK
ncbi:MAG: hypothetical protein AABZ39_17840 [Spirochaetota bacterium]